MGAFQVAPAELEAILCSSQDIADVAVIGIYNNKEATEWPRAFIVAHQQEQSRKGLEPIARKMKE